MANIGPTTAFYKVETSLTQMHSEVGNSRERIAAGKQSAHAGDRASNSAMIDAFRLDHVSAKAGIKGASVVMGYLETGMRTIGSASTLLARLQELAVLGANASNTFEEHEMINAEAEGIAQEFNRLIQGATYKGKEIFVDTAGSEYECFVIIKCYFLLLLGLFSLATHQMREIYLCTHLPRVPQIWECLI